jgi:hypothetical protein
MTQLNHWISYANSFPKGDPRPLAFRKTADNFVKKVVSEFSHTSRVNGLLFGQVQSGKTTHTFSVIASTADADPGFSTFVYLTSNSTQLQLQTLGDALARLNTTFEVCGPDDELRFKKNHKRPNLVILNKDKSVLKKWIGVLEAQAGLGLGPIFIVDDEGDAASQNTLVNKEDVSTIYGLIHDLRAMGTGSVYLQVTATPQALFLQSILSGEKPKFIHYFDPGPDYLGGEFFFGQDNNLTHIPISESDFSELIDGDSPSQGLIKALSFFVVVCCYFAREGKTNANALVHPHVSVASHKKVLETSVAVIESLTSPVLDIAHQGFLKSALEELNRNLDGEQLAWSEVEQRLSSGLKIDCHIINSGNKVDEDEYRSGFNVVVGANAIGRGVAFPHLQTVYYTRKAKTPQADTFWQHSRIFGYDRDWRALRIFMPSSLFRLFRVLQDQNQRLIEIIKSGNGDVLQIALPKGVAATRANVIDRKRFRFIVGGTNYFPSLPNQDNAFEVDEIFKKFEDKYTGPIELEDLRKVIELAADKDAEWKAKSFLKAIEQELVKPQATLLLRRDRKISANTGSMLSPNDREYGDKIQNQIVLTAYRVDGAHGKWSKAKDFWLINVKLPGSLLYYEVD